LFLKPILCWTLKFSLAWFPGLVPGVGSGTDAQGRKLTPKIAKELNAQDRKKLQKKNKA
jgi:hypothetical protein